MARDKRVAPDISRPLPKARSWKSKFAKRSSSVSNLSSYSQRQQSFDYRRRLEARKASVESFQEIFNGNGASNQREPMEELIDEDEEVEVTNQVANNAVDPNFNQAPASWAMKRFVTGLVNLYTIIGKDPEPVGHNIFRRMMVTLHVTLTYGYYLFLVPFKIVERDGSYIYETLFPQQVITWMMQFVCVCVLGFRAFKGLDKINIQDEPNSLCNGMTRLMTFIFVLAFIYSVSFRGKRFFTIFNSFNLRICLAERKKQKKLKNGLIQLLPFLIYFAISNWRIWGIRMFDEETTALNSLYIEGLNEFYLRRVKGQLYYYFVISIYTVFSIYTDLWTYYVHALLWAASFTVYICEKMSRKVSFESKQRIVIDEGSILFNNQRILMRKLNLALGPIIVIFFVEIIPFVVYTICQIFLKPIDFPWTELAMIPLKVGHIFVACEACSNADDLNYDILVKKIPAVKEEIEKIPDLTVRNYALNKYTALVNKFILIVQRSICLRAMDYFAVNYGLVGSVIQWLITLALLIAEWSRDSDKKVETALERIEAQNKLILSILHNMWGAQNFTMIGQNMTDSF